jgi:very-short-patch-repair endonuclease
LRGEETQTRPFPLEGGGNTNKTLTLEGGGKRVGVKESRGIARALRKRSTDIESYLWRYLKNRQMEGFKFRRQQPIGRYIVDFASLEKRLVIEVDGGQHAINTTKDMLRDEWLRGEGYEVLRFWDNQVFDNLEGVLETIRDALLTPHPDPLPQRERGDEF